MPQLSKSVVDAAQPSSVQQFIWDEEIKGFGLKIFPTGTKSFVYQYRSQEGRTRRVTIGKYSGSLSPDQARKIAKAKAFQVYGGGDPQAEKKARRNALTVNGLLDLYVKSQQFLANAKTTQATDIGRIDRHLRVLLGKEFVDTLSSERCLEAHSAIAQGKTAARVKTKARGLAKVTGGEGTAGKTILLLATAIKWGIKNKLAKSNPAAECGIKVVPGERNIILRVEEYERLFTTLQRMEDETHITGPVADAIRFIAVTGCRRGEVLGLRWRWVDLRNGQITLPPKAHKGGHKTKRPRIITLPTEAQAIISRQAAGEPDDNVFRNHNRTGTMSLTAGWSKAKKQAKLPPEIGLHGLRHSVGSHLAMAGASAVELMETLGHRQISTTARYIHFAENARSRLAERAAAVALAGLAKSRGQEPAPVVPLKRA